jgi:methionyl-tRNA synthetase
LANGLGNLVSRVARLCETSGFEFPKTEKNIIDDEVKESLDKFRLDGAIKIIFENYISTLDQEINKAEPWKLTGKELETFLIRAVTIIRKIAFNLEPFIPETATKIAKQFTGPKIISETPLFPRI